MPPRASALIVSLAAVGALGGAARCRGASQHADAIALADTDLRSAGDAHVIPLSRGGDVFGAPAEPIDDGGVRQDQCTGCKGKARRWCRIRRVCA